MTERYQPGSPTPETAQELIPQLYRLIDLLEAAAAKSEAIYEREGEPLDLGYADGLRDAANRIRNIITDAERA